MIKKVISAGTVHKLPTDLQKSYLLTMQLKLHGSILHRWRVMNGFAGLSRSRNLKQENSILKGRA